MLVYQLGIRMENGKSASKLCKTKYPIMLCANQIKHLIGKQIALFYSFWIMPGEHLPYWSADNDVTEA